MSSRQSTNLLCLPGCQILNGFQVMIKPTLLARVWNIIWLPGNHQASLASQAVIYLMTSRQSPNLLYSPGCEISSGFQAITYTPLHSRLWVIEWIPGNHPTSAASQAVRYLMAFKKSLNFHCSLHSEIFNGFPGNHQISCACRAVRYLMTSRQSPNILC